MAAHYQCQKGWLDQVNYSCMVVEMVGGLLQSTTHAKLQEHCLRIGLVVRRLCRARQSSI